LTTKLNLLIYEPYPMGKGGGNLRTLFYILKFVDRGQFAPVVAAPEETEILDTFRKKGVEVIVEKPPRTIGRYARQVLKAPLLERVRSTIDLMRYNMRLARLMRRRRTDVVYCNSIRALLLAGIGARLARVPALWYVKGALENGLLDRLGFLLATRIVFFCKTNRDDRYPRLVRWFERKIRIVRIGIDPDVVAEAEKADKQALRNELDVRPDRINAIILAQVYPPKGQHHVLNGLRRIVDAHPDFMLYIVGDSVLAEYEFYRTELDHIIDREQLHEHVRFTGWRNDALNLLATMDIVIHPSLAEGFGRAVLEAMALCRPVVASAVGGLREIIRDGENGFLVPPGDTDALVDRVTALAKDPALRSRLGREARRDVFANYLIRDKVRELETIWREMARAY
jgi:glycosyltransferase involved in cell wall biosynthesis